MSMVVMIAPEEEGMLSEVILCPGVVLVLSDALTNPFCACFELNSEGFAECCHVSLWKSWDGALN